MNPTRDLTPTLPSCQRLQELISAAFDGEAELDATSAEHAQSCPECRAFRAALPVLSRTFEPVRGLAALPPGLWARIELRALGARPRAARQALASLSAALLGAAAVGVLSLAVGGRRTPGRDPALHSGLTRPFELLALEAIHGSQRLALAPEIRLAQSITLREVRR